ncbi:hypothetical protein Pelo_19413 [Pelomyxa schiedti]|nr:hypothetical protein Pelo_19413 [Pelomyxa schiedti]
MGLFYVRVAPDAIIPLVYDPALTVSDVTSHVAAACNLLLPIPSSSEPPKGTHESSRPPGGDGDGDGGSGGGRGAVAPRAAATTGGGRPPLVLMDSEGRALPDVDGVTLGDFGVGPGDLLLCYAVPVERGDSAAPTNVANCGTGKSVATSGGSGAGGGNQQSGDEPECGTGDRPEGDTGGKGESTHGTGDSDVRKEETEGASEEARETAKPAVVAK